MAVTEWIGSPGDPVVVEPRERTRASARVAPISGDERLARQVARDDGAFVTIYERYHQTLYRYCRAMLRNDTDAQDALQSTWTRALVALRRGKRDAPLMPWLFRIAHNESVSQVRRRARQRPVADGGDACDLPEAQGESASAEQQVIERERFTQLLSDLYELPDRHRGALLMRELGGLSHDEIASNLGTSVGAAKQSILEARRGLQEFAAGRALICDEVTRRVSDGDRRTLRGRQIRAHLRICEPCSTFAASIEGRRRTLRAYTPMLAAPAAVGGLAHVVGAGGTTATGTTVGGATASGASASAVTGGGLAGAGTTGGAIAAVAGKSATTALLSKALAGAAVIVAAGATAHAIAGNSARHAHATAGNHRAVRRRSPAMTATGAVKRSGVAAARAGDRRAARTANGTRAGAVTSTTSRARTSPADHRSASAAPVTTQRSSGAVAHKPPRPAPAPRRIPHQQTRAPLGPTHNPAHNTPSNASNAPAKTPAPVKTKTPTGQSQTPPGQAQTPPGQSHTPPGQAAQVSPGESQSPRENAQVPPGQGATPPGQARTVQPNASEGQGQGQGQGNDEGQGQGKVQDTQTAPIVTAPTGQTSVPTRHIHVVPRQVQTPVQPTAPAQGETPVAPDPSSSQPTPAVSGSPVKAANDSTAGSSKNGGRGIGDRG
jgi:RNA polymerase sigma factor (sigma-70 family)